MRLILTILLIGLFKADAQMVINASAPYRSLGGFSGLLDQYSGAAAAYSLRKLDKDYTGAAIRVRKDTTGQPEQDIGFTASGDLDTAAIKSFLNARSGFVVKWYNQGDSSSIDFEQSTQASQPRIALNGVIDRKNNKVAITFNTVAAPSGTKSLVIQNSTQKLAFLHQSGLSSIFTVISFSGNTDRLIYDNHNTASGSSGISLRQSNNSVLSSQVARGVGGQFTSSITTGTNFSNVDSTAIITHELDNNNATAANRNKLYYNNGSAFNNNVLTNAPSTGNASFNLRIGASASTLLVPFNGWFYELIIFKGDKTSDRTGIRNAINTYYGIY